MPAQNEPRENNMQRLRGRVARTRSIGTKLTPDEEQQILVAAEAQGKAPSEWTRDALLREAKSPSDPVSVEAMMTELIGLQLFLTNVLAPIACGERMSADQYQDLMRQVKANKHQATREVIAQYATEKKEQPDD